MIFISYSAENKEVAGEIKTELERNDYGGFVAHDDIEGGVDWQDTIFREIAECDAFIGLVSDAFNASVFCQQEVGAALALHKPSRLLLIDKARPVGFARRFQAIKREKLLENLNDSTDFKRLRIESWIEATRNAQRFHQANNALAHFRDHWDLMSDDEKCRWILAAAYSSEVRGEHYHVGPFYERMKKEIGHLLTNDWLYENDKEGRLHDYDENPVTKASRLD